MASSQVCSALLARSPSLVNLSSFEDTPWIRQAHERFPRFGRPSDIVLYFQGNGRDYLVGLLGVSIGIFLLFVLYVSATLLWRWWQRRRTKGDDAVVPTSPSTDTEARARRLTCLRVLALSLCIVIFLSIILVAVLGYSPALQAIEDHGRPGIDELGDRVADIREATTRLESDRQALNQSSQELFEMPCSIWNNTSLQDDLQQYVQTTDGYDEDIAVFEASRLTWESAADSYDLALWFTLSFLGIHAVLTFLLVVAVFFELCESGCRPNQGYLRYKFILHFFVIRLFFLCTVVSWISSMVFVIGAVATADTCYGNPNPRIEVGTGHRCHLFERSLGISFHRKGASE